MDGTPIILVAEDDDLTRELLCKVLRKEGYRVVEAADGKIAIDRFRRERFDLVLSDVQMARASGMDLLDAVVGSASEVPIVLVTAYANPGAAMDAIGRGAADYLAKPVDIVALRMTVSRALERQRLRDENRQLRREMFEPGAVVGTSAAMLALYKEIAQVAPTNATVLISGESGAGKELVARTIHERSRRAAGPYVAVNCMSFAEGLLESELFGHERGAFTGAHAMRRGVFEEAHGGTLFLDEVGDVPAKMQGQLLRVLQEGSIRRVGGSSTIEVDVRVVAATNRDLVAAVQEKLFRDDLYYRLNVVSLRVPALRERGEDVVALTQHLVARHALRLGQAIPAVSADAMSCIRAYPWPGNVRELENALQRAVAMARDGVILPADLPALVSGLADKPRATIDHDWPTAERLQRRYVRRVLERTAGNKTAAAAILGLDRKTLQRYENEGALRDDAED